ncbi:FAD:protein FMN transferase [Bacteroidota bacterium]
MKRFIYLPLVSLYFLVSCISQRSTAPYIYLAGFTQGTTYHITYQSPTNDSLDLSLDITDLLAEFDMSLSTYIDSSLISRINKNEEVFADKFITDVFNESRRIYQLTDGAFDITVGPLIDAWGFGPGRKLDMSEARIDSILQYVGMEKVKLEDGRIIKALQGIRLDVNAIAQGYAVDVVAEYLESFHIRNYMIEIGGELKTKGLNPKSDIWRIGIDKPFFGNELLGNSLQAIVNLSGKALASSGNYRRYYEVDEKKIVHTVDPRTGYTRMSNLLSVTIISDDCITADALATSCMVLGLEDAKHLLGELKETEGLLIYTDEDGIFLEWMTDGMKKMISR